MRQERARIQRYASAFIWSLITRRALSPSVTGMARDLAITYSRAPTRLMRPSRTCAIVSWFMGHRESGVIATEKSHRGGRHDRRLVRRDRIWWYSSLICVIRLWWRLGCKSTIAQFNWRNIKKFFSVMVNDCWIIMRFLRIANELFKSKKSCCYPFVFGTKEF